MAARQAAWKLGLRQSNELEQVRSAPRSAAHLGLQFGQAPLEFIEFGAFFQRAGRILGLVDLGKLGFDGLYGLPQLGILRRLGLEVGQHGIDLIIERSIILCFLLELRGDLVLLFLQRLE